MAYAGLRVKEVTKALSGSTYPTISTVVPGV